MSWGKLTYYHMHSAVWLQAHTLVIVFIIIIIVIKIINILLWLITHTIACYCKPDHRGIPVYTKITVCVNRNLPIA